MLCPFKYVDGYFTEDAGGNKTDKMVPPRFGLDKKLTWDDLWSAIDSRNKSGNPGTLYKVFFLARHGEGVHNLGPSSDDDVNNARGPDPHLTQEGLMEVITVNAVWRTELQNKMRFPTTSWCSPLTRCMETNTITFGRLQNVAPDDYTVPATTLPKSLIVEKVRERCTHDKPQERLTKTFIHTVFPEYNFEDGFTEDDKMWTNDYDRAELHSDVQARAIEILRRAFTDPNSGNFISITTHSGFIGDLLKIIGHPAYTTHPAAVVPFVCSYTPASDHYLPFVCKIADSNDETLLLTVQNQTNDSPLIVKKCTDSGLLLHWYRWVLVPTVETGDGVQYTLVNEWTIDNHYYVTTWSKTADVQNGASTSSRVNGSANMLFYINPSGDNYNPPCHNLDECFRRQGRRRQRCQAG
ncbi:hypothetical protein BDN72DRAFT_265464 [Pluteus cervinus]|uniref:Uncharacterized protein n=1 Tax=Pluteus cervinus TaxID=181527 RepID=A0ACD3AFK8_9AGAR|nr:hypothetical protein BDN72DRAFT_265464 [Pluteus cervinus]